MCLFVAALVLLPVWLGSAWAATDGKADHEAGIEHYRAGAYRQAADSLTSVVTKRPDDQAARLYLALSHLRLGEDALAERHLVALRSMQINPRLSAQLDYVLEGIRSGPVSQPLRQFISMALDETMSLERSPRRPPFADSLLRRNFPYFP